MNLAEFALLRELLLQAADLPAKERDAFLERSCSDRPELRETALRLLRFDGEKMEPPARLGRYRVLRRLGQGGMGIVYLAMDPDLGREVAVKILPDALTAFPPVLERFRQEARLLARLNHPNIATIHSLESDQERLLLTMEYIQGETLADRLERGPVPLDSILPVLRQIACALEAAHESGIVHRDLKPANVLVTKEGVAKVLDFGIAKLMRTPSGDEVGPEERDAPMGTPGYMSPEQIAGGTVDARTDIWSFGCILHECVADTPPFDGADRSPLPEGQGMEYDPSRLPADTPDALRALLPRLLARDPARRPGSMREVRSAIDAMLEAREVERIRSRFERPPGKDRPPAHLPLYLTRFFGREGELRTLGERLHEERLISLTGPGGSGKTRLSVEAARTLADRFPDGVWFVDLASVRDPSAVPQKLSAALGLPDLAGWSLKRLVETLAPKRSLLVLDNCERLVSICGELVWSLLENCPALRILATSREPLAVEGESVLRLSPLPVAAEEDPPPESEPAVALFLDRARTAAPGFEHTPSEMDAIRGICRRVEGLPLAIELSATWAGVLGPEEILERLHRRIDLLSAAGSSAHPAVVAGDPAAASQPAGAAGPVASARHLGLRAMIDGSYESLSPAEQALLRGLSVFRGGCTLDALETVCLTSERSGWQALDLVRSLLSKSLLERHGAHGPSGGSRYRMLDTLREYAEEKLQAAGEELDLRRRHFVYYRDLFSKRILSGPEQAFWIARFRDEEENVRAALESLPRLSLPVADAALFVGKLSAFWVRLGRWEEGRRLLAAQIEDLRTAGPENELLRVRLMITCAEIARSQGDLDAAQELAQGAASLALGRPEHPGLLGSCYNELGNVAKFRGNQAEAARLYARCLEYITEDLDAWNYAGILLNRGVIFAQLGRGEEAEADFRESLRVKRAIGDKRGIAHAVNALGLTRLDAGAWEEARLLLEESLALKREIDDRPGMVATLLNLGRLSSRTFRDQAEGVHQLSSARGRFTEALALARRIGDRPNEARLLMELGFVAMLEGRRSEARALFQLSLAVPCESRNPHSDAWAHLGLGHLDLLASDLEPARQSLLEAARLLRSWGRMDLEEPLELSAAIERAAGNPREAVTLLAAADRIRRQEGHAAPSWKLEWISRLTEELRRDLDPGAFADAWARGANADDLDRLLPGGRPEIP